MLRGRQLSRDTEHRKALRRNLAQSLFEHGKVRTTYPKAREVRGFVEKLITTAREGTLHARRQVIAALQDRRLVDKEQEFTGQTVVQKLFDEIAPKFGDRSGGYTRIIKLADHRIGDGGSLVQLELCLETNKPTGTVRRGAGLRRKRNEKRQAFANKVLKKKEKGEAAPAGDGAPAQPAAEGEASAAAEKAE
jgi:large subunit ribosomal protein L17